MFVICDVDGTVCESARPLSNEMVGLLRALAVNHRLVFISGTDSEELRRMVTTPLACDHWVLAEYGAYGYGRVDDLCLTYSGLDEVITMENRAEIVAVLTECLDHFRIKSIADDVILDRACKITL